MPLLFTNLVKGKINAAYTGRFAFIREATSEHADGFIEGNKPPELLEQRLKEELEHSRVFIKCKTGLIISALRWIVRIGWLITRNENLVYKYYQLRAMFFICMYSLHEELVGSKLISETSNRLTNIQKKKLNDADCKVFSLWKEHLSFFSYYSILLFSPVLLLMGFVTTKDFTVISFQKVDNQYKDHNSSSNTTINLNNIGFKKNRLTNYLLKLIIIENWANKTFADDINWARQKFRAEKDNWPLVQSILKDDKQYHSVYPSYEEYCLKLADFVLSWSNCQSFTSKEAFLLFLKNADDEEVIKFISESNDEFLKKAVCYFYYHGN